MIGIGGLMLFSFWRTHRHFLAISSDDATFTATPPLFNRKTPWGQRLWLEWTTRFGLYTIAFVAFLLPRVPMMYGILLPISPPNILVWLLGWLILTLLLTAFTMVKYIGRPLLFPAAILLAFGTVFYSRGGIFEYIGGYSKAFYASFAIMPEDWFWIYGLAVCHSLLVATIFVCIMGGMIRLNAMWRGVEIPKFRKKFLTVLCVCLVVLVCVHGCMYSTTRRDCCQQILLFVQQNRSSLHSRSLWGSKTLPAQEIQTRYHEIASTLE